MTSYIQKRDNSADLRLLQGHYQKLMGLFLDKKFYQAFKISILKKPLRLYHTEPQIRFCKEQEFQKCFKLTKALLDENTEEVSKSRLTSPGLSELSGTYWASEDTDIIEDGSLPGNLIKYENFQNHRKTQEIIYRKPIGIGWYLSPGNNIQEKNISNSDLEYEIGSILKEFISHYQIGVLKLENNRFIERQSTFSIFTDQLIGLTLNHLSLDRSNLHGCDLATLFRLQVEQMSLRFCSLEDEDVHTFWESLSENKSLMYLNLNFNRIKELGCKDLAQSLRLNRSLKCLSLVHNAIENTGFHHILSVLQPFRLDTQELTKLRKTKLDSYLEEFDENGQHIEKPIPLKSKVDISEEPVKDKPVEVPTRSTTKSTKSRVGPSRSRMSTKSKSKAVMEGEVDPKSKGVIDNKSTLSDGRSRMIKLEVEAPPSKKVEPPQMPKLPPPLGTVTWKLRDGISYCDGNLFLSQLFLSQNQLTLSIVPDIVDMLIYQRSQELSPPETGLANLTIQNDLISLDMVGMERLIRKQSS